MNTKGWHQDGELPYVGIPHSRASGLEAKVCSVLMERNHAHTHVGDMLAREDDILLCVAGVG